VRYLTNTILTESITMNALKRGIILGIQTVVFLIKK